MCECIKKYFCCCCSDDKKDEPLPKERINGPTKKRACTDILCTFIYAFFLSIVIYCAVYGFWFGRIDNIAQPFDVDGNRCGRGLTKSFPMVFFNDKITDKNAITGTICVASCPRTEGELGI